MLINTDINDLIYQNKISLDTIIKNQTSEAVLNYEVRDQEVCQYDDDDKQTNAYFGLLTPYLKSFVPKSWIDSYHPKRYKETMDVLGQYWNETLTQAVYVSKDSLIYQALLNIYGKGSVRKMNTVLPKIIKAYCPVDDDAAKMHGFLATIPQGDSSHYLGWLFVNDSDYVKTIRAIADINSTDNNTELLKHYYHHDHHDAVEEEKEFQKNLD